MIPEIVFGFVCLWVFTELMSATRSRVMSPTWLYFSHDRRTPRGAAALICENANDTDDVCGMGAIQLVECDKRRQYSNPNYWTCIPRWSDVNFENDFVFEKKHISCNTHSPDSCVFIYALRYSEAGKKRFAPPFVSKFVADAFANWAWILFGAIGSFLISSALVILMISDKVIGFDKAQGEKPVVVQTEAKNENVVRNEPVCPTEPVIGT